jgi:hypothetical protein
MPNRNWTLIPILVLVTSLFWIGSVGNAAEFPAASVPDNAGVNTGVTTLGLDDEDFVKMRKSGINYIRFDLIWEEIEKVKGRYVWGRFERVMAKIKQHDIRPILILDYNNKLYDPEAGGIRSDEARDGYANFAAAAVARYNQQMRGIIWEIWNEPNSDGSWKPKRNADEYMALLKRAVPAMRKADPTATVINGGILELSWSVTQAYLERCFQLGLLDQVDGLGVHLYGGRINTYPERIIQELADLRRRMAAYGARADYPILNTEFGAKLEEYAILKGLRPEMQELGHAETYVRMYLLGLLENLKMNVWYEWRTKGEFSGHAILNSDGSPRQAYTAIANLTAQLSGYTLAMRIDEFGTDDFVLVFEKGAQRKLVAWTAGGAHAVSVRVRSAANSLGTSGMMGEGGSINVENDALSVRLTGSPVYIDIGAATVGGRHAAP